LSAYISGRSRDAGNAAGEKPGLTTGPTPGAGDCARSAAGPESRKGEPGRESPEDSIHGCDKEEDMYNIDSGGTTVTSSKLSSAFEIGNELMEISKSEATITETDGTKSWVKSPGTAWEMTSG
jgi:hypothetical protein